MRIEDYLELCNAAYRNIRREEARQTVAKVIEFYIPKKFRDSVKLVGPKQRGKVIEFVLPVKKSA
jgi:hypothetical protein